MSLVELEKEVLYLMRVLVRERLKYGAQKA